MIVTMKQLKSMELVITNMRGIIRATGVRVVKLLLVLIVDSLKLPGLIMP